jgi:antitoxin component YwqK of YwqJK toxin-antitoxin module
MGAAATHSLRAEIMRHLLILACLAFGTGAMADEGDFDFSSLGAKKALRDYKKAIAKDEKARGQKQKLLDEDGTKQEKKTRDAFVENLRKALKKSMQAGNLDEANKISAAIKLLKKGASPAGGSAANRTAQKEANRPTKVTYWPNGQKKSERHYKNGKPDGLETRWWENGQKQYEGHWKNGKQDGLATQWYGNGQMWWESHYKNDKKDGLTTFWDANGKKKRVIYYKNGREVSRKEF